MNRCSYSLHQIKVFSLLKHDHLLREVEFKRMANPLVNDFQPLKVKASSMEVGSAYMIARRDGSWAIQRTLANESFYGHNWNQNDKLQVDGYEFTY